MKIAILADTHAGARNDSPVFNTFFFRFYEEVFFPYIKANNIDYVIHLGDVFDRRKYVNMNTLYSWHKRVFQPLSECASTVDILVGNHDVYYKNSNEVNSVEQILSPYKNFRIFKEPTETSIVGTELPVLYVPWICDETSQRALEKIDQTKCQVCMGHLEIIGFDMFLGYTNAETGLFPDVFDKFHTVLTGHFHHKSTKNGIHYLGAPYPITWNDFGDRRGFHVFDTDTLELEFIENPIQIFHKLYYNDTNETYESIMTKKFTDLSGMYVKVIVQRKGNLYWFEQYLDALQKANPADINVIEASIEEGAVDEDSVFEAKDTLSILVDCVDTLELTEHKEKVNALLRDLYIEALNTSTDSKHG